MDVNFGKHTAVWVESHGALIVVNGVLLKSYSSSINSVDEDFVGG
jgi:hypothetical protein